MQKSWTFTTIAALMLALVIGLMTHSSAMAQLGGGLTYTSGVQILNLDGDTATIALNYYNQDGSVAANVSDSIAGSSSKTYFPLTGVSAGFSGSLVVSSDKQVTAIANLVTSDLSYGAATTSFNAGSTTVSLPLLMCNNSGFNTFFNVQNAGSADANITVNYVKGSHGANSSEAATIKPGAAKTFDQESGSSTVNCSALAGSDGKFIGGASITSDQPIVATVMQLNTSTFPVLMGYNGFTGGSSSVAAPLIMANNGGFNTGVQIQNAGTTATVVTVDYGANSGGTFNPTDDTCNLAPGESCTLIQAGGQWGSNKYVGSANITNSAGQDLVAIVNQVAGVTPASAGPYGTAYEGFNPSNATAGISTPLIMANNGGYLTGIQVQNAGGSACASVTVSFGANSAGTFNPADESTSNLAAGSSHTFLQAGGQWGSNRYVGSAEISAPGCSIVAIVNQVAGAAGDRFLTYNGYNR